MNILYYVKEAKMSIFQLPVLSTHDKSFLICYVIRVVLCGLKFNILIIYILKKEKYFEKYFWKEDTQNVVINNILPTKLS